MNKCSRKDHFNMVSRAAVTVCQENHEFLVGKIRQMMLTDDAYCYAALKVVFWLLLVHWEEDRHEMPCNVCRAAIRFRGAGDPRGHSRHQEGAGHRNRETSASCPGAGRPTFPVCRLQEKN